MRIIADPPLDAWRPATGTPRPRQELLDAVNATAGALGLARLEIAAPLIVTGHQPWLWHPGILVKDIAAKRAAARAGGAALHLVVDHDPHDPLRLELPVNDGGRLRVEVVTLAPTLADVPSAAQPPADARAVQAALRAARDRLGSTLVADIEPILKAFDSLPDCKNLGRQIAAVTARLMRPYVGDIPMFMVSDVMELGGFMELLGAMTGDPVACARAYNRAILEVPVQGIAPLTIGREMVELPLWFMAWGRPRARVLSDISDSWPRLVLSDGSPIALADGKLVPKAMTLTALFRGLFSDWFIHGTGGGQYDRVTERWWSLWPALWRSHKPAPIEVIPPEAIPVPWPNQLAPMAVVTADVYMDFNAPSAEPADLHRARWWAHHLGHNIDRQAGLHDSKQFVERKRELLAHMDDDREAIRRSRALLAEIHRINDELARAHPELLAEARQRIETTELGLANRAVARKRDWCFALYDPGVIRGLADALGGAAAAPEGQMR